MTPREIHFEMSKIVNRPGYALLTHHRDDFEVLDLRHLDNAWHPHARMLWIVRESGTNLAILGVHESVNEDARAVLDIAGPKEAYLLTRDGVAPLTIDGARRELATVAWSTDQRGRIWRGDEPIADVADIVERQEGNTRLAHVKLYPIEPIDRLSLGDMCALRIHAERAAVEHAGSLFVRADKVRLGADDLEALIAARSNAWLRAPTVDQRPTASRSR